MVKFIFVLCVKLSENFSCFKCEATVPRIFVYIKNCNLLKK